MSALLNRERRARARRNRGQRRDAIVEAADHLFVRQPWPAVTLDYVGRRVGVGKGIASLHFATKEELFLEVLRKRLAAWFDDIEGALQAASRPLPARRFATTLANDLAERPELTRMLALLHNVVEQNVEVIPAQLFADWLRKRALALAGLIEERVGGFAPGEGAIFLRRLALVAVGTRQTAAPSGVFALALADEALDPFRADLRDELDELIARMLPAAEGR
jgi:AcrR family transcriptional regulator